MQHTPLNMTSKLWENLCDVNNNLLVVTSFCTISLKRWKKYCREKWRNILESNKSFFTAKISKNRPVCRKIFEIYLSRNEKLVWVFECELYFAIKKIIIIIENLLNKPTHFLNKMFSNMHYSFSVIFSVICSLLSISCLVPPCFVTVCWLNVILLIFLAFHM